MTKKQINKAIKDATHYLNSVLEFWDNPAPAEKELKQFISRLKEIKKFKRISKQLEELERTANNMGQFGLNDDALVDDCKGAFYAALDCLNEVIDETKDPLWMQFAKAQEK